MVVLNERAKHRLRIAAALLRAEGHRFDWPRDQFYDEMQAYLARLDAPLVARLKELTDWVEGLENANGMKDT